MLEIALIDERGEVYPQMYSGEIDRGPDEPSYTVDTLMALHELINPRQTRLRLLIGADQMRIFDTWRSPERIIELAEPVVMVRPPDTRATLLDSLPVDQREAWANRLVDVDAIDLSSTQIRERVQRGESIKGLVCPGVAKYIKKHRLYQDG